MLFLNYCSGQPNSWGWEGVLEVSYNWFFTGCEIQHNLFLLAFTGGEIQHCFLLEARYNTICFFTGGEIQHNLFYWR